MAFQAEHVSGLRVIHPSGRAVFDKNGNASSGPLARQNEFED
jgi:hypothetical protein